MRLTERRFRFQSTIHHQNYENGVTATATLSIENANGSPFVRPCAVIKMFSDYNNNTNENKQSSNHHTFKAVGAGTSQANGMAAVDTPRSQENKDR